MGIKDINLLGKALRMKWLALRYEQSGRPWTLHLPKPHKDALELFFSATKFTVHNGHNTDFWRADWLPEGSIMSSRPLISSHVERPGKSVAQSLQANSWVCDIKGAPSNEAIDEFFTLWDDVHQIQLSQGQEDALRWKTSAKGVFSVAEVYDLFFIAKTLSCCGTLIWKSRAPSKVKFFMWLADRGRCLTADNLNKRGWPHHSTRVLCSAAPEDCAHLFVSCDYTSRVWRLTRQWTGITFPLPSDTNQSLSEWWLDARENCRKSYRDNFDCLVQLGCWMLWKERNERIFNQKSATAQQTFLKIKEEVATWKAAGVFRIDRE